MDKLQGHRGLQGPSPQTLHFTNQENEDTRIFPHGSDHTLRLLGCLLRVFQPEGGAQPQGMLQREHLGSNRPWSPSVLRL